MSATAPNTSRSHSTLPKCESSPDQEITVPHIGPEDSYDIVIIGGANAGLALACALCMSNLLHQSTACFVSMFQDSLQAVTKPSIRQTTRILLLEGGSLDRVRNWNDRGHWENRVSSLTAENVNWLKSMLSIFYIMHGVVVELVLIIQV